MRHMAITLCCIVALSSCKSELKVDSNTQEETVKNYTLQTLSGNPLASGTLQRLTMPSNYIKERPVDIWLPDNYSVKKSYAVLYMHDGQMLFDSTATWNKQEWKVDEWATQLMADSVSEDFIVVGIHNIAEIRWFDLFPQKAFDYLNEKDQDLLLNEPFHTQARLDLNGDNYLKFLVEELKPVIDAEFAVKNDKEHTFIAGSSMGGLMSMYALSEYPHVFHGAACLSTHWVGAAPKEDNLLPEAIFSYMDAQFPKAGDHKIYFDYGNQTLDQYYPQYAQRVDAILMAKGYTELDSRNLFFEGANHSENAWNQRLNYPFEFLLGK